MYKKQSTTSQQAVELWVNVIVSRQAEENQHSLRVSGIKKPERHLPGIKDLLPERTFIVRGMDFQKVFLAPEKQIKRHFVPGTRFHGSGILMIGDPQKRTKENEDG